MKQYTKYLIRPTDQFDPVNFYSVDEEVQTINQATDSVPSFFKVEIIVSFLKDHSLQDNWIEANPALTDLVTSGSLFNGSIEALFESCRNNPAFREGLENYLKENLTK